MTGRNENVTPRRSPGSPPKGLASLPVLLLLLLLLGAATGEKPPRKADVPRAVSAARSFLVPVDAGLYADTWEDAAAYTKSIVPKAAWEDGIRIIRSSLGAVRGRTLRKSDYTRWLAGAPVGEYVVVQFDTTFEKRQGTTAETIVTMRQKDGAWRVSGYFIK